jgi:hypothetical protein
LLCQVWPGDSCEMILDQQNLIVRFQWVATTLRAWKNIE